MQTQQTGITIEVVSEDASTWADSVKLVIEDDLTSDYFGAYLSPVQALTVAAELIGMARGKLESSK